MCDKKEPVFAFLALILHLVPSSLLPLSHNKEKAMCEGGRGAYTQRNPGRKKRAHYYWEGKMIKG